MSGAITLVVGVFHSDHAIHARSLRSPDAIVFCARSLRLSRRGDALAFSPRLTRGVVAILASGENLLTYEDLYEAVWGLDPNGGPLTFHQSRSVLVHDVRRALHGFGVSIETDWGRGVRVGPQSSFDGGQVTRTAVEKAGRVEQGVRRSALPGRHAASRPCASGAREGSFLPETCREVVSGFPAFSGAR